MENTERCDSRPVDIMVSLSVFVYRSFELVFDLRSGLSGREDRHFNVINHCNHDKEGEAFLKKHNKKQVQKLSTVPEAGACREQAISGLLEDPMLSGASISETLTTLLIISVAISMLLVVSGCNDRREVIPEEPRLSGAQHDAMVRFHGSESNTIHRVDHSIKATSEITTLPRSTGRSADPVEEQRQHSAWVWLQARQGANLQAAVADYRPDYDIQNRDIQNRPTDYGVIAESDVSQWRASQTLKF